MRDHTVDIDTSASPTTFDFARNFNVAVPFIDQHLELGRAHRVAIRSDHGDVTYGKLAERVNRAGVIYMTHTRLDDVYALRLAIGQTRTGPEHVAEAWRELQKAAAG